jgi:hypothetical protein
LQSADAGGQLTSKEGDQGEGMAEVSSMLPGVEATKVSTYAYMVCIVQWLDGKYGGGRGWHNFALVK